MHGFIGAPAAEMLLVPAIATGEPVSFLFEGRRGEILHRLVM
ncbi:MAG: hypothetical protein ACYCVO_08270 [Acidimicrobiales bacterium]